MSPRNRDKRKPRTFLGVRGWLLVAHPSYKLNQ